MNLVIDIGNTRAKLAIFDNKKLIADTSIDTKTLSYKEVMGFVHLSTANINHCIISSVSEKPFDLVQELSKRYYLVYLTPKTPVSFQNLYQSPATLGADRIALVAGAIEMHKKQNILIIDAGTCITYDFINAKNEYLGGAISPGIDIRFRSLNTFTKKLPLIEYKVDLQLIGRNTENSILSGVLNGVICEIEGIIEKYKEKFGDIQIILSGGNTIFFDKQLKNNIFAFPKLLLYGLNSILKYNAQN